ncbi:MAG: DNA polymerase III subunit chi, partial [Proteobacteria bacterium]|nr:DNA polymerase III subunit chi [Burkholderiales bacterium]
MTRIDFYVNVDDRARTACVLCAKALERDVRLFVLTADASETARVDKLLWCQPQLSFVPHVRIGHPLAGQTPVIVDHLVDPLPHDEVLLNLTDATPALFSRFERLIEIVSLDEDDRARARERWRFYADRGYPLVSHDRARAQTSVPARAPA